LKPAAILRAKAAGFKLAILSNELDLFYGVAFRKSFPCIEFFDVIVDATYTKILKPDPQAYEQCLAELNLPASACVFVDDQQKNVDGALALGIPTVHFDVTHPAKSYATALELLGV
jgi:putative hydrolase of the HAD superfamily